MEAKNILVTGANGQLGTWMRKLAAEKDNWFFTDIAELDLSHYSKLDITDCNAVNHFMKARNIKMVVNCAAYTNVERAEDDRDAANLLNNKAVENLALACQAAGAVLIHVSTDYVFQGNGNIPCTEDEPTNPLGVYGKTKLAGEECIKRILGEASPKKGGDISYIIIRTAWLYSEYGNNFVKTIRRLTAEKEELKVVFDQVGTPTYAGDLAGTIYRIIEEKLNTGKKDGADSGVLKQNDTGIYHFSNEGVCSWYDFAKEIAALSGNKCDIQPCHSDEFPCKVKRPAFSVLDKTKIKKTFGIKIPYWKDSLGKCIEQMNRE